MSEHRERITFYYDNQEDSDIHAWVESMPKRGRSHLIQEAIRYYLQQSPSNASSDTQSMKAIINEMNDLKMRMKSIEENSNNYSKDTTTKDLPIEKNVQTEKKNEIKNINNPEEVEVNKSNENFVAATSLFQNLGK